jgi:hypothetical protein
MDIKKFYKNNEDKALVEIISKLPYNTRKRIEEEVREKEIEINTQREVNDYLKSVKNNNKYDRVQNFKDGMKRRREDLKKRGIIQPIVRYNKELEKNTIEELSKKSKENFIKELEQKRFKQKEGCVLDKSPIKYIKGKDGSIQFN